jgi:histidinol-phosphatase
MSDLSKELEVAIRAARSGSQVALRFFGTSLQQERKADGTWVTEADVAAEEEIRKVISAAFPGHNILGEERGLTSASGGAPVDGAPTWIVDPIDGTNNFMASIPVWGTLVGLRHGDVSVVGACNAPALEERYDAARGSGARFNGSPIKVDPITSLDEALLTFAGGENFIMGERAELFRELGRRCRRSRGFGDFWGHMLVARGAAHVMVEPDLKIWDVTALQPIVEEAGGRLTQIDGRPWVNGGSCLTTNGPLHDEVVGLAASLSGSTP